MGADSIARYETNTKDGNWYPSEESPIRVLKVCANLGRIALCKSLKLLSSQEKEEHYANLDSLPAQGRMIKVPFGPEG